MHLKIYTLVFYSCYFSGITMLPKSLVSVEVKITNRSIPSKTYDILRFVVPEVKKKT